MRPNFHIQDFSWSTIYDAKVALDVCTLRSDLLNPAKGIRVELDILSYSFNL